LRLTHTSKRGNRHNHPSIIVNGCQTGFPGHFEKSNTQRAWSTYAQRSKYVARGRVSRKASLTVDRAIKKDPRTTMESSVENWISGSKAGTWLSKCGSEAAIYAERGRKKENY
jgi:hypothetical protein